MSELPDEYKSKLQKMIDDLGQMLEVHRQGTSGCLRDCWCWGVENAQSNLERSTGDVGDYGQYLKNHPWITQDKGE